MQFIQNGPDIPEQLLQAHEEGRVIFFCGAGISYPAGLPGFDGLVEEIYRRIGIPLDAIEQKAFSRNQFDAVLDLLERRIVGQRIAVRTVLAEVLQPDLYRDGATDTHAALLQLARNRKGALRLVTTNFDRIFEHVAKQTTKFCNAYVAPMLPVPKNSRWDGLVYLHGMLPEELDESGLNRLVLTSGDFGLAYLTERWASRFVSELFRNYIVCFIGYSINDPVLRYMMDALAADRMLGEDTPQAYALGDCEPSKECDTTIEWEAKGVIPILYEVAEGSHDHSALHQTLISWAQTYRDGVFGKERIVVEHALARPSASTQQDNFVGRMLWALSHESGIPAQRFADLNPVPPLEWLEAFSENRYQHNDLDLFGISSHTVADKKLQFSLIRRPTPHERAPWMTLVSGGASSGQLDKVLYQLARWLVRHLNDPALIIWIAQRGGQLHDQWAWIIERELDRLSRLSQEGKTAALNDIQTHAPNAVPGKLMQTLWSLLLTGRVKSPMREADLYRWKDRLKRNGPTTTLRLELRELLAPKITLKKPFSWREEEGEENIGEPTHIRQLVDWELVLAANNVLSTLPDMDDQYWQEILPTLLDDFHQLLCDALDLLREMGEAEDFHDRSDWDLPSVSRHWQNRGFHDWVALIELLRDAWLAVRMVSPVRATRIAQGWFEFPYPTYKRLAFFAASHENCISSDQWVDWLLADGAWWLWSSNVQREVMRLLVLQGQLLTSTALERLEAAILAGPPRKMFRDDLEVEHWERLVNRSVWLRLAKLSATGLKLGDAARDRLTELSSAHPYLQLAANESDEFSSWMSGTGDPDYQENRHIDIAPRKRLELVEWLKQPIGEKPPDYEDTWRLTCRKHTLNAGFALSDLANEGVWPASRWRDALYAWSEKGRQRISWRYFAKTVYSMPDSELKEVVHGVTQWLDQISHSIDTHESVFLDLCRRILALSLNESTGMLKNGEPINEPVMEAINHPIGRVTQAIINFWFRCEPSDNEKLPNDIEQFFTNICDGRVIKFRHGRVILSSRLIALFRVDREWTEKHLLPHFDWDISAPEARAAWEGFLWSPRLYRPLLVAFKRQFLDTANHYIELGKHKAQFAAFLTYAALEPVDGYTYEEYQTAIGVLPQEGLQKVARVLSQALEGAGEQREDYWRNRIQPFWAQVWPKSRDVVTDNVIESLSRMIIAAGDEFPSALREIHHWLCAIEQSDYIVHRLQESGHSRRFPPETLQMLDAIIKDQPLTPGDLEGCLEEIIRADPHLEDDLRLQRLREYCRKRGV